VSRARDEYKDKVLVINKPSGPTSFDMVDAFRKASGIRKVGHTGTLDPLAEGVLLMCTGRATRASEHFMNLRKIYEFTVRFGVETDTLDAEGRIVDEKECPHIADGDLRKIATEFIGDYELEPPAYSAIKHNGRRMYELARSGEAPEVAKRTVRIHDMQVTGSDLPDVRLRLECSRGTYVRSIARDFGRRFGVPAHIRQLVRTAVGPFKVEDAFDGRRVFDGDLEGLVTLEPAAALAFLPGIVLSFNPGACRRGAAGTGRCAGDHRAGGRGGKCPNSRPQGQSARRGFTRQDG
jgi:tRNA pseudouridine55 synthase